MKPVRRRTKTRPRRNTGRSKARKRVKTKGRGKPRQKQARAKKPHIKRMKVAPRLFLEDRVGRLIFKLATRGAEYKDTTIVKLRCTATFRLDSCVAVSHEDKTWEAVLVGLERNL